MDKAQECVAKFDEIDHRKMDFFTAHIHDDFGRLSNCPERHVIVARNTDNFKNIIREDGKIFFEDWMQSICFATNNPMVALLKKRKYLWNPDSTSFYNVFDYLQEKYLLDEWVYEGLVKENKQISKFIELGVY